MSMIADIIVLALVIAYGVFVVSYLYSKKETGAQLCRLCR